jgi:hypothetical protein
VPKSTTPHPSRHLSASRRHAPSQNELPPVCRATPPPLSLLRPAVQLPILFHATLVPASVPPRHRSTAGTRLHRARLAAAGSRRAPRRRRPARSSQARTAPGMVPGRYVLTLERAPNKLRRPDRRWRAPPAGRDYIASPPFFIW